MKWRAQTPPRPRRSNSTPLAPRPPPAGGRTPPQARLRPDTLRVPPPPARARGAPGAPPPHATPPPPPPQTPPPLPRNGGAFRWRALDPDASVTQVSKRFEHAEVH